MVEITKTPAECSVSSVTIFTGLAWILAAVVLMSAATVADIFSDLEFGREAAEQKIIQSFGWGYLKAKMTRN